MKQKPLPASMQPFLDGKVILIDKPYKWTSFDAVKKIRILTGVSKVGHAGTLDPLATGLLIICTGNFTKKISLYMNMEKEYTGTMGLGASTKTYDLESAPENFIDVTDFPKEKIHRIVVTDAQTKIIIPESAINDLFEPNFCTNEKNGGVYCHTNVYRSRDKADMVEGLHHTQRRQ